MKFKSIASIASILIFINAVLFLVVPEFSMSLLGRSLPAAGIMITRISGACALGLSLVLWQLRDLTNSHIQISISKVFFAIFLLLIIIDLHGILTSAINPVGWIIFITDLLLAFGFMSSIFTGTTEN